MTRLEQDLIGYSRAWEGVPQAQVLEEMASWSMETKRIPDPYSFSIRSDGKLISPQTGTPVEQAIEKSSHLGHLEWQAFQRIQEWDKEATDGVSFWISPPHPERSKFTKIIASEIVGDGENKQLFNRAIMLNLDANQALELHTNLNLINGVVTGTLSPEEIRSRPVFLESSNGDWTKYLTVKVEDEPIIMMIRTGEDIEQKAEALEKSGVIYDQLFTNARYDDANVKSVITQARNMGYFGKYDSTCPSKGAFATFLENALNFGETFDCPNCPYKIPAGKGITRCPGCGITKEEAKVKCV